MKSQPDVHAERVILASIFRDNELFFEGAAELVATDFSLSSHQRIFGTINSIMFGLVDGVSSADIITVADELGRKGDLESIGGYAYLSDLWDDTLNVTKNISQHVAIVKNRARLRRVRAVLGSGAGRAEDQTESALEIIADMQARLIDESADGDGKAVRIGEVTPEVERRVEEKRHVSDEKTALSLTWGIPKLDAFTKGAHEGEVTVLGGESGAGKSSFLLQMILANAREGVPCALFSLEMTRERMVNRCYPQMSKIITADMMRDPRLINLHTHVPEIHRLSGELNGLPIWIDDSVSLDISVLIARMRMMVRKYGIRLFGIDYLQLILNKAKREGPEALTDTMFKLRDFPKAEPRTHTVVLSQYSNADGFMKKKRRSRADLKGSSSIHQAAQNVLLLTVEDDEKKDPKDLLDVEFLFDKQRDGRKGKVLTCLDRDHLLYRDPEPRPDLYTQTEGDDF